MECRPVSKQLAKFVHARGDGAAGRSVRIHRERSLHVGKVRRVHRQRQRSDDSGEVESAVAPHLVVRLLSALPEEVCKQRDVISSLDVAANFPQKTAKLVDKQRKHFLRRRRDVRLDDGVEVFSAVWRVEELDEVDKRSERSSRHQLLLIHQKFEQFRSHSLFRFLEPDGPRDFPQLATHGDAHGRLSVLAKVNGLVEHSAAHCFAVETLAEAPDTLATEHALVVGFGVLSLFQRQGHDILLEHRWRQIGDHFEDQRAPRFSHLLSFDFEHRARTPQ
mmetsp:Transcript_46372/g.143099  ORF Transcript_46372/g.143099 Transcript_46372/m.143099 type:complete len:277 (-) Transcript_46372:521-1351(-)